MFKYILTYITLFISICSLGQTITGTVIEQTENSSLPLIGANVYWLENFEGTTTDANGKFTLEKNGDVNQLIVSFVGFQTDTITVGNKTNIEIALKPSLQLETVTVEAKTQSTKISLLDPINVQTLGTNELAKAPCCNLSESFETNASIDASFSDAVTGTKQIKMLGLSGAYIQTMQENMPGIRGLHVKRGLGYIPGPWLQSIQISKGAGSVVNGYESISGQINLELKKPQAKERFLFNTYANQGGRTELNLMGSTKVNDKWSTSLFLHGNGRFIENDVNDDGFLDNPTGREFHALNRWKYNSDNGWEGQIGIRASKDDKLGGQKDFDEDNRLTQLQYLFGEPVTTPSLYGIKIDSRLINGWAKMGKVMQDRPGTSVGFQVYGTHYKEESFFGYKDYIGEQNSFYFNSIYQSIIGNTNHQYKAGFSTQVDEYKEYYGKDNAFLTPYERTEVVPGAFFEYTFLGGERWNIIAGLRGDYHNLFGFYATPRLHARYSPTETTAIKLAAGQGRRTANIFAENIGLFLTNGDFYKISSNGVENLANGTQGLQGDKDEPYYGLDQEVAWNFGLNVTQQFVLDYREGSFTLDYYHSTFDNVTVVDQYLSPGDVYFYNLDGECYTNSFQAEVNYELIKRLDLRMAYRWVDAYMTYQNHGTIIKPFTAKHRAFVNLEYKTRKNHNWAQWKFDITGQWIGKQAIPTPYAQADINRPYSYSDDYFMVNSQITRVFSKKFEVYAGVENLTDYTQDAPIEGFDDPYSRRFDASKVWAPIFGRNIYVGLNYRINRE